MHWQAHIGKQSGQYVADMLVLYWLTAVAIECLFVISCLIPVTSPELFP